ncbi:Uncharacterised protein [Pragia fontium]|uniref:hypothetical protein n=1 Tax=Pragia fontium TaxID=82985 RepID=UPI000E00768D|nr:hypothetical protein [Pragia fontium]SUB82014.1 Uncharacterised protein [Pragia fontium]
MKPRDIKIARRLLSCNQTELASKLGWSSKRNVVSIEDSDGDKACTEQTALAIECLLRRESKFDYFTLLKHLYDDVDKQTESIKRLLEPFDRYFIEITDYLCALHFKKYAKSVIWSSDEFEINFTDAKKVEVSKVDFIEYQFMYTDEAKKLEEEYGAYLDDLRDAQHDVIRSLLKK